MKMLATQIMGAIIAAAVMGITIVIILLLSK